MKVLPCSMIALGFLALSCPAQDILYYKFDEGGGNKVVNYATGTAKGPSEGTLMGTATAKQRWTVGKFEGGLMGGDATSPTTRNNYVSSGWDGAFTGSFTVAWHMKMNGAIGANLSYLFSDIGSFRCFTNGVAGTGLWVRNWGGADIKLATDIQALSAKGWIHVALVVDANVKKAFWYVNGTAQTPITIAANPNVAKGSSFNVGMHTTASFPFQFDIDEFRFSNRAASSKEVLVWSLASQAADGDYGKGCGATLGPLFANQVPTLGQSKYGLKAQFNGTGPVLVMIGSNRHSFLSLPILPLDLGIFWPNLKGCMLETSMEMRFANAVGVGGTLSVPLSIPNDKNLSGATLYSQFLLLSSGKEELTNGWATSIR